MMTAQSMLCLLVGAPALLVGAAAPCVAVAESPNILWLTSEDNNHASLGCYGNDLARTPNLDALARQGIVFENCYAPPVCAPARFTLATGMFPTMCGPGQHHRAIGRLPKGVSGFPADLREAGYYTSNDVKTDYNSRLPMKSLWNHNRAGADWRQRRTEQPFFSVINHTMCHESCLFAPRTLTVERMDPACVRVPPYLPDTPEIRKSIARAMDCVAEMDRQCGEKLRQLEADGLAGDTIIFYYGDNGGVIPRSKRFLHESGVHVPLIVYFPPKWQHLAPAAPGSRVRDLVHFVDFAPTVLSLAGVVIPPHMRGRAFAGSARRPAPDQVFCSRDRTDEGYDMARCAVDERFLYIRNFRPDIAYGQHLGYAFQSPAYQSWKSMAGQDRLTPATSRFWGAKPHEELYDKLADPDNMVNLAAMPEFAEVLGRMRSALDAWMIECHDNGLIPEGSPIEGYEASRKPGAWSVERTLALANMAGERNAAHLPAFIRTLEEDADETLRWWAAQGCAMLVAEAGPATAVLRRTAAEDSSPAVQIAAAEALHRVGEDALAVQTLRRWLAPGQDSVHKVQALNVVLRMGQAAEPLAPEIRALAAAGPRRGGVADTLASFVPTFAEHLLSTLGKPRQPCRIRGKSDNSRKEWKTE